VREEEEGGGSSFWEYQNKELDRADPNSPFGLGDDDVAMQVCV